MKKAKLVFNLFCNRIIYTFKRPWNPSNKKLNMSFADFKLVYDSRDPFDFDFAFITEHFKPTKEMVSYIVRRLSEVSIEKNQRPNYALVSVLNEFSAANIAGPVKSKTNIFSTYKEYREAEEMLEFFLSEVRKTENPILLASLICNAPSSYSGYASFSLFLNKRNRKYYKKVRILFNNFLNSIDLEDEIIQQWMGSEVLSNSSIYDKLIRFQNREFTEAINNISSCTNITPKMLMKGLLDGEESI